MLVEVRAEPLVDDRLHRRLGLRVAELRLGLPLELRLAHFYRQDGGEALAHVVARQREVRLFEEAALLRVLIDDARQRRLEAGEMRAALVSVDVVHEGEHGVVVLVVVLERQLDPDVILGCFDVDDLGM